MPTIEIVPTVVPESHADLFSKTEHYKAFARTIHVDAADGVFAPHLSWIPAPNDTLPLAEAVQYEAHLMAAEPIALGTSFVKAGASRIIAHVEAFGSRDAAQGALAAWREAGAKEVGLAILIDTPLDALEAHVASCDSILLMTIPRIGTQGIPYDPRGAARVAEFKRRHPEAVVAVDGGVNEDNIAALVKAGASRLCVGSTLARAADPAAVYKQLTERAQAGTMT